MTLARHLGVATDDEHQGPHGHSAEPPSRPAVSRRPRDARPRAPPLRDGQGPADRQPARPHRPAVVRRRRAVRQCVARCSSRRTTTCSACSTARASRSRTSASRAATAGRVETDARKIWRTFAAHYHLFRGTPTRIWLDHAFATVFGIDERLTAESADRYFDRINECLAQPAVPPARAVRALQHRGDRDDRVAARSARASPRRSARRAGRAAWSPRTGPIRSSIPEFEGFAAQRRAVRRADRREHGDVERLSRRAPQRAARSSSRWARRRPTTAIRRRRPSDLSPQPNASGCSTAALAGTITAGGGRGVPRPDADRDGADEPRRRAGDADPSGQLPQPQSARASRRFGRDKGADIPTRTDYVRALKPLLDRFGNERNLTIILFTLDETSTRANSRRSPATIRC